MELSGSIDGINPLLLVITGLKQSVPDVQPSGGEVRFQKTRRYSLKLFGHASDCSERRMDRFGGEDIQLHEPVREREP